MRSWLGVSDSFHLQEGEMEAIDAPKGGFAAQNQGEFLGDALADQWG